jgi:hypothetical protein
MSDSEKKHSGFIRQLDGPVGEAVWSLGHTLYAPHARLVCVDHVQDSRRAGKA